MALSGRDFANRTLYSQAYRPRHQSLLSGQVYYVTVQATSRNAARLTANATSAGVKARRAAAPRLGCLMKLEIAHAHALRSCSSACLHPPDGCQHYAWVSCAFGCCHSATAKTDMLPYAGCLPTCFGERVRRCRW